MYVVMYPLPLGGYRLTSQGGSAQRGGGVHHKGGGVRLYFSHDSVT